MGKLNIIADDYGLSPGINKAIEKCVENKILSGISVMTTGKAFNELPDFIKKFPDIDIGIHLDLVSGNFLTDYKFTGSIFEFIKKCYFVPEYFIKIQNELMKQIKVLSKITVIKHIDSHRHIHFLPKIFKLVNQLAEINGINRIRYPLPKLDFYNLKYILSNKKSFKYFLFYIFHLFNKNISNSGDNFFGLFQTGNLNDSYIDYIMKTKYEFAEFMVHPGYVDESLLSENENLLYKREKELEILLNNAEKFNEV